MTPAYAKVQRISELAGVRSACLVNAVEQGLRSLSAREGGLRMRCSFTFVTEKRVHFVLFIGGKKQGLYCFAYDALGEAAPSLRELSTATGRPEPADAKALALERVLCKQLASVERGIIRAGLSRA